MATEPGIVVDRGATVPPASPAEPVAGRTATRRRRAGGPDTINEGAIKA